MTNNLSARDASTELASLLCRERASLVDFILALASFDRHKLYVELGYSSLFHYLREELSLSEGTAYYRMTAAQLVQRFPQITPPLRDGWLCITTVVELKKLLKEDNCDHVLPQFFHKSRRETQRLVAAAAPMESPPQRDVICSVALPPAEAASPATQSQMLVAYPPRALEPLAPPAAVVPLTAEQHRLHVTVSAKFLESLDAAKAALSHKYPAGRLEDILAEGLELIVKAHAKRKALTDAPRTDTQAAHVHAHEDDHGRKQVGRYLPAKVRREVWRRDQGHCQWPLARGGVCGSTHQLEFDHMTARALGGESTVDNLRLVCRAHNQIAAQRTFGDGFMAQFAATSTVEVDRG